MNEARRIWQRFAALPGASVDGVVGIASEHAIAGLIRAVERYRPRRILELGAGIGTLTYTLLVTSRRLGLESEKGFRLITVENEAFCLQQLPRNLAGFAGAYRVATGTAELRDREQPFDLLVVDGGGEQGNDLGTQELCGLLAPGAVVLVEGGRLFQRRLLQRSYGHRPHLWFRSEALIRPRLESRTAGVAAENKPYHLLVLEPSRRARVRYGAAELSNRLLRRLRRWVGGPARQRKKTAVESVREVEGEP